MIALYWKTLKGRCQVRVLLHVTEPLLNLIQCGQDYGILAKKIKISWILMCWNCVIKVPFLFLVEVVY